jgi:uncharacterized protein YlaN (UPF0358 family)
MVIKIILIPIFIILGCYLISEGINRKMQEQLDKQTQSNKQLLALYQNKVDEVDTLYKILKHIQSQLSLLGLPECPEEELRNIPFEIVGWITQLERIRDEKNGVQE